MKTISNVQKAPASLGLSKTQSVATIGHRGFDYQKRKVDEDNRILANRLQNIKSGLGLDEALSTMKKPKKLPTLNNREDQSKIFSQSKPHALTMDHDINSTSSSHVFDGPNTKTDLKGPLSPSNGFRIELTGLSDGVRCYLRWKDMFSGETIFVSENALSKCEVVREDLSFAEIGYRKGIRFEVTLVGGTTRKMG